MGMLFLKGDETPQEVIAVSYGLEAELQKFYTAAAGLAIEPEVGRVLANLAEIEVKHKDRLFELYLAIEPGPLEREAFEAEIKSEMTEGGFNPDELLERNLPTFKSARDVLNFAMMLEAQAMDLYMRYADKCEDPKVKEILFKMADEEKAHLKRLGVLQEKQ
jgi:sulfur-carrier protein adenylyltransferase/sulfurtransferase